MQSIGVVGIGNMGSGLAKNLIKAGYAVHGHDLLPERIAEFEALGGKPAANSAEVGAHCDAAVSYTHLTLPTILLV